MYCQMIRVISSPSSSTTGLATLIFAIEIKAFFRAFGSGRNARRLAAPRHLMARRRRSCKASR
jgi:hypothetical protein